MKTAVLTGLGAAALLATPADANDRDLKATHISAFDCRDLNVGGDTLRISRPMGATAGVGPTSLGVYGINGSRAELICPLPLNNVDLGGAIGQMRTEDTLWLAA